VLRTWPNGLPLPVITASGNSGVSLAGRVFRPTRFFIIGFSFSRIFDRWDKIAAEITRIQKEDFNMAKSQDVKKDAKKKAQKSLKEKRAEKKSKKGKV